MRRRLAALFGAALLLAGCAGSAYEQERLVPPAEMRAFLADKPAKLHRLYARLPIEGPRNDTLNNMRIGLAAFEAGELDAAASAFDAALLTIEAVYAENERAEAARSLWVKESAKDFKGEPYERAMAYYYRGLLYMAAGDYQNARASFKGGLLQDGFSFNERFKSQFALLSFLEGWADRCAGGSGRGADSFEEARRLNADLAAPREPDDILLIAELGRGPLKAASGSNRELLTFLRGPATPEDGVAFTLLRNAGGAGEAPTWPGRRASDLYLQASTRGGRQIDGILAGKAVFKDTAKTAGTVGIGVGAALLSTNNRDAQTAGAALALVGLVAILAAEAAKSDADIRAWDNLPGTVWLATASRREIAKEAKSAGVPLVPAMRLLAGGRELRTEPLFTAVAGPCTLAWGRSQSAFQVADVAPGAVVRRR